MTGGRRPGQGPRDQEANDLTTVIFAPRNQKNLCDFCEVLCDSM